MYRFLIIGIIFIGCTKPFTGATPLIKEKTLEEYIPLKELEYPACKKDRKSYSRESVYLSDETNITYSCWSDTIRETIRRKDYPFVEFTKVYSRNTKKLQRFYTQVGDMDIADQEIYDKDGKLISRKVYKQKSHLSYKDILEVLEKNGYLDLKKQKQLIGYFGFKLSYDEQEKIWYFYTIIQPHYSRISRSLSIDDNDGSLIEYIDTIIPDSSELQGLTPGKKYNWIEEHKIYKKRK